MLVPPFDFLTSFDFFHIYFIKKKKKTSHYKNFSRDLFFKLMIFLGLQGILFSFSLTVNLLQSMKPRNSSHFLGFVCFSRRARRREEKGRSSRTPTQVNMSLLTQTDDQTQILWVSESCVCVLKRSVPPPATGRMCL